MAQRTTSLIQVYTSGGSEQTTWLVHDLEIGVDGEYSNALVEVPSAQLQTWATHFDADDLLGLFRDVRNSGRQLALMAHVSHPRELETRVAILHKKAELDGIELPEDVAQFLGQHIRSIHTYQLMTRIVVVFSEL